MYNILICDDEQDIVNALKIYLSGGDYCLFEASNGREALEVVEKNDIHLILMDIMMPQLDGIAATAKLREKSNVPIILLTAKSESSDKVLGLNIGADDYITKPFSPSPLTPWRCWRACALSCGATRSWAQKKKRRSRTSTPSAPSCSTRRKKA